MTDDLRAHTHDQDRRDRAVPWTIKDALIGVALVASASVLALISLQWLAAGSGLDVRRAMVLSALALLLGLNFSVVWYFAIRKRGASWEALGFARPQARWSVLLPWPVLLLSLFFSGLYTAIVMALGLDFLVPEPVPVGALGEGPYKIASVAIIGLVGPLTEEVFYRGFLLAALVAPIGGVRAAVIASAIFAANHGNVSILVPVFISGLLLSWLYLKTRSLWPPMTAHAAQNLLALSLAA